MDDSNRLSVLSAAFHQVDFGTVNLDFIETFSIDVRVYLRFSLFIIEIYYLADILVQPKYIACPRFKIFGTLSKKP